MAVKLQFKEQAFQQRAVESVAGKEGIFKGQTAADSRYTITVGMCDDVGVQQLSISNEQILENLRVIQKNNGLPKSLSLDEYEVKAKCEDENGNDVEREFLNFTVEMETGVGKTFVYTNTILELNKNFGWTKFIIVVPPSTAIKEGVLNSLNATKSYFVKQFENTSYEFFGYTGAEAHQTRNFANADNIQIMVATKSSIDKAGNIINKGKSREEFRTPIEFIRDVRPVVIIDEPQSVDTQDGGKDAIANLNPCVVLRYSATHKNLYNLVYKLGPVEAHRDNLVKEILVSSIRAHQDFNKPYIKVVDVEHGSAGSPGGRYKAKLEIDWRNKKGEVERKILPATKTTDMQELSGGREFYADYKVANIDTRAGFESVHFDNGTVIPIGNSIGDVDERAIKKAQIMRTIELHFDNEKRLLGKGIKVLSLFFIDQVAKYRGQGEEEGDYAVWFDECYDELRTKYPELTMGDAVSARGAYFSEDKKGGFKDTKGNTKDDDSTYDKIMRNKEKLLSFDEPIRFIFSHSALKEGWDNPNVFQICTLLEPKTEFTRRQKIGRGLRLCVNQGGNRIEDMKVNQLYVISDENFAEFAAGLQKNYEDDLGISFDGFTVQFLSEVKTTREYTQERLDKELIDKTIKLNKSTGAIDESGVIVDAKKVVLPTEITTNPEEVLTLIKANNRIDEAVLQAVPVEIKKFIQEEIPTDISEEVVEKFAKCGLIAGKENKPTKSMKEVLKKGVEEFKKHLPERAEYAAQAIFDACNAKNPTPQVSNADNTDWAIAKKEVIFSDPFKQLWDKIKTKTRYQIKMDDDMLKTAVLLNIAQYWAYVDKVKITYTDADIDVGASGISATSGTELTMNTVESKHRIPDLLRYLSEQCNISKKLAFEIFAACDKMGEFLNNPQIFMEQLAKSINKEKRRLEVANIVYIPTGSSFDYYQVFDEFESFIVNKVTNAVEVEHSLYNYVKYESDKVELLFAKKIDTDKNIELFLKLPTKKYVISTPVGDYTPDWAIIKRNIYGRQQTIYFVIETKSTKNDEELRKKEETKIKCAKRHFAALGYEVEENAPLVDKNSKYVVKKDYKDFALEG